jgi:hypothetical protein
MEPDNDRPILDSYWVIPGIFLAGAHPGINNGSQTREILIGFLNAGFNAFINLTGENELPSYQQILLEEAGHLGFQVIHQRFSILDRGLPSRDLMVAILDALDRFLENGSKVYLHCWGGIGRTGTTVGCFLVRHGLSGEEALERLSQLYHSSNQSRIFPKSPETQAQVDLIQNWHED